MVSAQSNNDEDLEGSQGPGTRAVQRRAGAVSLTGGAAVANKVPAGESTRPTAGATGAAAWTAATSPSPTPPGEDLIPAEARSQAEPNAERESWS